MSNVTLTLGWLDCGVWLLLLLSNPENKCDFSIVHFHKLIWTAFYCFLVCDKKTLCNPNVRHELSSSSFHSKNAKYPTFHMTTATLKNETFLHVFLTNVPIWKDSCCTVYQFQFQYSLLPTWHDIIQQANNRDSEQKQKIKRYFGHEN